ncbi:MAG: cytochrome c oxidase subunit II [Nannocystaceae bacterium]|nr:cytochrome c oxidase subunit II [Nannocystaceae bacterium]
MILSLFTAPENADAPPAVADGAAEAAADVAAAVGQAPLPPVETAHPWAMPTAASTFAEDTDNLYYFITALDTLFFVLIMGAMGYFMWKYRRRSKDQKTSSITHSGVIEFLWSAIPTALLLVVFVWGECDFVRQSVAPADPLEVRVTGRKWSWTVEYPKYPGVSLNSSQEEPALTLMVPKGKPVRLTMTSADVIHSFFVPAFRVKRDVVPGRYTQIWFEATRIGEFNLFCTEYCGDFHSQMTGVVKVLEPDDFERELVKAGILEQDVGESMAAYGERIYSRRGCVSCHSVDGSEKTGPSWKGLYGRTESLSDGSTVKAEDQYIQDSIYEPNKQIVAGFAPQMPSYQGQLDNKQVEAVIEYIKTLK